MLPGVRQQSEKRASKWKSSPSMASQSHRHEFRCLLQQQTVALFPVPCQHLNLLSRLVALLLSSAQTPSENATSKDRYHADTHTDTRARARAEEAGKTKGSYGDKPFPLFSNYLAFSSPPRLITSRPGMTFGNGWRGPAPHCSLLLLLLLSALKAVH